MHHLPEPCDHLQTQHLQGVSTWVSQQTNRLAPLPTCNTIEGYHITHPKACHDCLLILQVCMIAITSYLMTGCVSVLINGVCLQCLQVKQLTTTHKLFQLSRPEELQRCTCTHIKRDKLHQLNQRNLLLFGCQCQEQNQNGSITKGSQLHQCRQIFISKEAGLGLRPQINMTINSSSKVGRSVSALPIQGKQGACNHCTGVQSTTDQHLQPTTTPITTTLITTTDHTLHKCIHICTQHFHSNTAIIAP